MASGTKLWLKLLKKCMRKIIISPYSRKLRNGNPNPKNYPWWKELVSMLNEMGDVVSQVGAADEEMIPGVTFFYKDLKLHELKEKLFLNDMFICVDNFFHHFAHANRFTTGAVLWSQSDPNIFGYPEFFNILRDRRYLRKHQFRHWDQAVYNEFAYMPPEQVIQLLPLRTLRLPHDSSFQISQ